MLQDLLSGQKAGFPPSAHTELRGQLNRSRRVTMLAGNIVSNSRADISGVSARVYKNGTYGFSSMAEFSEEAARMVLHAASENAEFMDRHAGRGLPALPSLKSSTYHFSKDIHDVPQRTYIDFLRALDAYMVEHCPGLISRSLSATEDSMEKILLTSDAMDAHSILPRSYCYLIMTAETPDGAPVELFKAVWDGTLNNTQLEIDERSAACVMLTAEGYPESYRKGDAISGLDDVEGSLVFHAGTKCNSAGTVVTNGGRVLCVTTLSNSLPEALLKSLQAAENIKWKGRYYRHDIGQDLLKMSIDRN